jgi:hypothetical protein
MERNVDRVGFWQQHLDGWRKSGLTQTEYCRQQGLKFTTFARYRNRINRERRAKPLVNASFVPVSIKAQAGPVVGEPSRELSSSPLEIRLHNGRVLAVSRAFDETQLGRLIRLLEALPC